MRWTRCSGLCAFFAVSPFITSFLVSANPPRWDYEVLPANYDQTLFYGTFLNLFLTATAVENPVTGLPALFRGEHEVTYNPAGHYIHLYFAQRSPTGWPQDYEEIAVIDMTDKLMTDAAWAISDEGVPSCAFSILSAHDPITDGWTETIYFIERESGGWPSSPTVIDIIVKEYYPIPVGIWPYSEQLDLDIGPNNEPCLLYTRKQRDYEEILGEYVCVGGSSSLRCAVRSGQTWYLSYNEIYNESSGHSNTFYNPQIAMDRRQASDYVGNIVRCLEISGSQDPNDIRISRHPGPNPATSSWGELAQVSSAESPWICELATDPQDQGHPGVVFMESASVYYTDYNGSSWSTPFLVPVADGLDPESLAYLNGVAYIPVGAEEYDPDDEPAVLVWRNQPQGSTGPYMVVADEQDFSYCTMAINHHTGARNVLMQGCGTGLDGKTLMAYKVPLIYDNFDDEDLVGWSAWGGTWSASGGSMHKTSVAPASMARTQTDPDIRASFSYYLDGDSTGDLAGVSFRYQLNNDKLRLVIGRNSMRIDKRVGGVWSNVTGNNYNFPTNPGTTQTWYDVVLICVGDNIKLYRAERGSSWELVFNITNSDVDETAYFCMNFFLEEDEFRFDNILVDAEE